MIKYTLYLIFLPFFTLLCPALVTKDFYHVPYDAKILPSGVAYKVLTKAKNNQPTQPQDILVINYRGFNSSGVEFDNSYKRKFPLLLRVDSSSVIRGWQIMLPLLKLGEKVKIWIPAALAYGTKATKTTINQQTLGNLIFEIKVEKIIRAKALPKLPKPSKQVIALSATLSKELVTPANTKKQLTKLTNYALVEFSKWSANGKLLATSVFRPTRQAAWQINYLPTQLQKAIHSMQVGEKAIFRLSEKAHTFPNTVYQIKLIRYFQNPKQPNHTPNCQ